jgi:hypothetical protein
MELLSRSLSLLHVCYVQFSAVMAYSANPFSTYKMIDHKTGAELDWLLREISQCMNSLGTRNYPDLKKSTISHFVQGS